MRKSKKCPECGKTKRITSFYKDSNRSTNLDSICKDCRKIRNKKYLDKNREHKRKVDREGKAKRLKEDPEWAENTRRIRREVQRKRRALKLEVNECFTKDDESYTYNLFKNKCANCGTNENLTVDHHKSLEKKNALTRQNAVVLCVSCNSSKHDKDPEDFYTPKKLKRIEKLLFG